jgi:DNA-binding transcriptional ArsR family regulator
MVNDSPWDEKILKGMANPIKRKIIDSLSKENMSFTQIQDSVGVYGNHGKLGYHLRALKEFVEFDSELKKHRLNYRGELLARIMRDYRSQLSKVPDYKSYVQGLKLGDHAIALYRDHSFKRQVVSSFFQSGLSRGYAGAYFASERKLDSDVKAIGEYGLDFDSLSKKAFTVMSSQEWYLNKGKADPETMMSNIERLTQEKKDAGFAGLVVSGEPGFLIESGFGEECIKWATSFF